MIIKFSHVIVRVLDINRLISKRTGARITRKAGTPQVTARQRAVTEMGLYVPQEALRPRTFLVLQIIDSKNSTC